MHAALANRRPRYTETLLHMLETAMATPIQSKQNTKNADMDCSIYPKVYQCILQIRTVHFL